MGARASARLFCIGSLMTQVFAAFRAYKTAIATGDCLDRDRAARELDAALGDLRNDFLLAAADDEQEPALKILRMALAVASGRLQDQSAQLLRKSVRPAAYWPLWSE